MTVIRRTFFTIACPTLITLVAMTAAAQAWSAKLDDTVRFYQPTDVGAIVVGTKKSLYAVDSATGDILWRRKTSALDENDVAPVPGTDLVLLSFEKDQKTRIEATDVLSGDAIWQSDKLKGAVMQMAVDIDSNLLAVVLAKDAKVGKLLSLADLDRLLDPANYLGMSEQFVDRVLASRPGRRKKI